MEGLPGREGLPEYSGGKAVEGLPAREGLPEYSGGEAVCHVRAYQ